MRRKSTRHSLASAAAAAAPTSTSHPLASTTTPSAAANPTPSTSSTPHSTSTANADPSPIDESHPKPSKANKRKAVAFDAPGPLLLDDEPSPASGRVTRSRRSSTLNTPAPRAPTTTASASTSSSSTTSAADPPSAKSLGKRRAVSPCLATPQREGPCPEPTGPPVDASPAPKRRKLTNRDSTGPSTSFTSLESNKGKGKEYNLRSRPSNATNPSTSSTSTSTKMPRKGTRASRAAKAKARALEDEEDAVFESRFNDYDDEGDDYDEAEREGGRPAMARDDGDVEMDEVAVQSSASSSKAGKKVRGARKSKGKQVDLGSDDDDVAKKVREKEEQDTKEGAPILKVAEPAEGADDSEGEPLHRSEEGDDDDEDDEEDDDDEDDDDELDHDDEDDFDDEDDEEIDEYETSLGFHGEERDYPSGEEEDMPEAPRTFNSSGDPLSDERQAAMDEADALFGALAGVAAGGASGLGGAGGLGGAFQALRGMMSGMSTRLKGLLTSLKAQDGDATAKLLALQELAELLSISTEDTLAGYFQTEAFSKELVAIVRGDSNGMGGGAGGGGAGAMDDGGDGGMTPEEAIAFGLDPAEVCGGGAGGADSEENDVQMMLLACRCLANLMEALPGSAHSVVYAGAVPVLCSKLKDIQYIELAEQTLSTLEKISEEVPSAIVREGGLSALLTYLDFFSFHVQRTAVTAAANCCRSLSFDSLAMVKEAIPIFKNILGYPDQRVVEQACLAVVRIVDSYRHYPDRLEQLLTSDLLTAIKALLNPDSTTVGPSTYTQCLKALTTAAKASPAVAITLVELGIANTLYHLLTGVSPPEWVSDEGKQVLDRDTTAEDDMLVMQNLVQRPKEQVQETLNLVCELLPPLPKDGIFDSKAFVPGKERSASRLGQVKQEEGAERSTVVKREEATPELSASSSTAAVAGSNASPDSLAEVKMESDASPAPAAAVAPAISRGGSSSHRSSRSGKARSSTKDALVAKRLELVSTDAPAARRLVVKRYFALLLPTLVDVYSASVSSQVRTKAVLGLLKIVQFCEADALADILHNVPFAAFIAAILSSHDQTQLITNALQLIELLLVKMPDAYQYTFRREGVMHEVDRIASSELVGQAKKASAQSANVASTSMVPSLSSSERQAKDAITLRAQHLRDAYGAADSDPAVRAKEVLERIKQLVCSLGDLAESKDKAVKVEHEANKVLNEIADLFANEKNPLSSFEMIESGLVEGLLKFAVAKEGSLSATRRQELLAKSFMPHLEAKSASPAFGVLVKRLQESLSRMEEFEVVVAAQNANDADARRNGTTMLGRQLKLRLIAEDGQDIPRSCTNIVVSIHAIATFQAFNDYLRPRILSAMASAERFGGASGGGGTLSSLLAAFAAAAADADAEAEADADDAGSDPLLTEPSAAASASKATTSAEASSSAQSDKAKSSPKLRRRSSRLSGKGVEDEPVAEGEGVSSKAKDKAASADDQEMEGLDAPEEAPKRDTYAGTLDAASTPRDDRLVNVEVAEDGPGGSKVVAKTPDGTRIGTPVLGSAPAASSPRPSLASGSRPRASYAAALKAEPTDFHLQFSLGGRDIGLDTTVFGAVHRFESEQPAALRRNFWHNIYDVKFRKVEGKVRPDEDDGNALEARGRRQGSVFTHMPASIPADSQQAKILQLLHVLRNVSADYGESEQGRGSALADTAFVNSKLTAKLNRQLEEPMIVASACLPDWAVDLAQSFPFLFPFDTRFTFLQSTSFGYARLMQKWIGQTRSDTSRRDENLGFLGRLQRQKVRISRERILESAFKVFELYGSSRASLEVEFFNEVGSGLGPTLEFYALVSKEFARKSLELWRLGDHTDTSDYVHTSTGLFPTPVDDLGTEKGKKALKVFRVLGQFVAKSMMDSRIIDVNFSRTFMRLVLEQEVPLSVASVKLVDPALGKSLAHLEEYVSAKEAIEADESKTGSDRSDSLNAIEIRGATVSDLTLDFTLPGTDIELKEGGKDLAVDIGNVEEYVKLVIDWTLRRGIVEQVLAFKQGFSTVFPVQDLQTFTPAEMVLLSGAIEGEDWSVNALVNAAKADHGFTMDSRVVQDLFSVMAEFDKDERRAWLSFTTGAQRLPIGGFASLRPPLTIVRKDGGDKALPSCMTCTNYVKLPDYSTREILKEKLKFAVREGAAGFHLS